MSPISEPPGEVLLQPLPGHLFHSRRVSNPPPTIPDSLVDPLRRKPLILPNFCPDAVSRLLAGGQ